MAASLAVHVVLAGLLVLHAPRLRMPEMQQSGPPEPIIPILILPRTPPPAAQPGAAPTQIRLHRRVTRFSEAPPIAPLVAPAPQEAPARATAPGPRPLTLPTYEDALAANARNALRSRRNCDDPNLSRLEREACQERVFGGGRDAPQLGLGVEGDKAAELARAAGRKEQDYGYKRSAGGGPGTTGSGYNAGRIASPGAPNLGMGASSRDVGGVTGNDAHGEAGARF